MKLLVAKERKGRKKLKTAAKLFDAKIPDVDPFLLSAYILSPAGGTSGCRSESFRDDFEQLFWDKATSPVGLNYLRLKTELKLNPGFR
ncbi:MAG: hypothetical protein IPN54_10920 [Bacteroidetes bacterium]|nr:hypothetical protein [Bacteroidota bacterium]